MGLAIFSGISQGDHTYTVKATGYDLQKGFDPFNRPLGLSGRFTIQWYPVPGEPWPENIPWQNEFWLIPKELPPPPEKPSFPILVPVQIAVGLALIFLGTRRF